MDKYMLITALNIAIYKTKDDIKNCNKSSALNILNRELKDFKKIKSNLEDMCTDKIEIKEVLE